MSLSGQAKRHHRLRGWVDYHAPVPAKPVVTGVVGGFQTRAVPSNMPNLIGRRFGRMQAVALSVKTGGGAWICRCQCGEFELRSSRSLRNPLNVNDGCHLCRRDDFHRQRMSECPAELGDEFDRVEVTTFGDSRPQFIDVPKRHADRVLR